MMGHCPVCQKLVPILPALRDTFGRPRKRVVSHETSTGPKSTGGIPVRCAGSRALI